MPANAVDAAALEAILLAAPFHRWLGLRISALDEDGVEISMPWREEFVADPGIGYTHGGILATLIDLTADFAVAAKLGRGVPTVDMRVDYHRAALSGEALVGRGRIIRMGRTLATAEATIHRADGTLMASGRGVYLTAAP